MLLKHKNLLKTEKILIVISIQDIQCEPDVIAGFWFSELTHPLKVYHKDGYDVDIASPKSGLSPFDGFDLKYPVNSCFRKEINWTILSNWQM